MRHRPPLPPATAGGPPDVVWLFQLVSQLAGLYLERRGTIRKFPRHSSRVFVRKSGGGGAFQLVVDLCNLGEGILNFLDFLFQHAFLTLPAGETVLEGHDLAVLV